MGTRNWNDPLVRASGEDSKPEEWLPKMDNLAIGNRLRRPSEILKDVNQQRLAFMQRVLTRIIKRLDSDFIGEPISMWIDEPLKDIELIFEHLKSHFADKQWNIEIIGSNGDQKGGLNTQIRISPMEVSK